MSSPLHVPLSWSSVLMRKIPRLHSHSKSIWQDWSKYSLKQFVLQLSLNPAGISFLLLCGFVCVCVYLYVRVKLKKKKNKKQLFSLPMWFKHYFLKKKARADFLLRFLPWEVPRSLEMVRRIFCTPLLLCLSAAGLRMTDMKLQITVKRATSNTTNGNLSEKERHLWPHNPGNLIYLLSVICMLNFLVFLQQNFFLPCQPW